MAKLKTSHTFELEIVRMIKSRNGSFDEWLRPQLQATAANRVMLAKIQAELEQETSLLLTLPGSMGQQKRDAHPLLAIYDKLQRTLILQYAALGLNYNTTPAKVTESTRKDSADNSPLSQFLDAIS